MSENEKCRYLIIDAKDVINYPCKTWKNYNKCDRPFINLEEIFEYYDIPLEYRYFVIKMNSFFSRYECQEYFTKTPFDFTGYTRFNKNDKTKIIKGRAIIPNLTNVVEFQTSMEFKNYDEVVEFAFRIIDAELLQKYKLVVSKIFNIHFDYDNINELDKFRRVKKK